MMTAVMAILDEVVLDTLITIARSPTNDKSAPVKCVSPLIGSRIKLLNLITLLMQHVVLITTYNHTNKI